MMEIPLGVIQAAKLIATIVCFAAAAIFAMWLHYGHGYTGFFAGAAWAAGIAAILVAMILGFTMLLLLLVSKPTPQGRR